MKNSFLKWVKNNIEWTILIFIVLAVVAPYLLTRPITGVDFSNTGQIGDTVGGLTAPILNFLTIILLYLALKEQIDSNKIQKDIDRTSRDYDIIFDQLNTLKEDFDSIRLSVKNNTDEITYTGIRAIFEYKNIVETELVLENFFNEYSVKSFMLSYTFINGKLFSILKKNYLSKLDQEDKKSVYATLMQISTPLKMVSLASGIFSNKKKGQTLNEIEKSVSLQYVMSGFFDSEFKGYNPNVEVASTTNG